MQKQNRVQAQNSSLSKSSTKHYDTVTKTTKMVAKRRDVVDLDLELSEISEGFLEDSYE